MQQQQGMTNSCFTDILGDCLSSPFLIFPLGLGNFYCFFSLHFPTPEQFLDLAGTETEVIWHAFFNVSKHIPLIHFLKSKLCSLKVNFPTSPGRKRFPGVAENFKQNSHFQKLAGQNLLLRYLPNRRNCWALQGVAHRLVQSRYFDAFNRSLSKVMRAAWAQQQLSKQFKLVAVCRPEYHTKRKCKKPNVDLSQQARDVLLSKSVFVNPTLWEDIVSGQKPMRSLLGDHLRWHLWKYVREGEN